MPLSSLVVLWKQTLHAIVDHVRPLLIGVTFFTVLMSIVLTQFTQQLQLMMNKAIEAMPANSIADTTQGIEGFLHSIAQQSAQGQVSLESLQALQTFRFHLLEAYAATAPLLIGITILLGVLGYIGAQFYFIAVIKKQQSTGETMKLLAKYFLPLTALAIWVLARSFAWIPFIGPIFLLIYIPRFTLSSLLLVRDHQGIFTAARNSFNHTRGHWWYIVKNTYLTAVVVSLGVMIDMFIINLLPLGPTLHTMFTMFSIQAAIAILMVFAERLAVAIEKSAPELQRSSAPVSS